MSCDEGIRRHLHRRLTHKHDSKTSDQLHHDPKNTQEGLEHIHQEIEHEHFIKLGDEHHHHDHISIELSPLTVLSMHQDDQDKKKSQEKKGKDSE